MAQLHPCHWLSFELALALVASSTMVGPSAASTRAQASLQAIKAWETVLEVGSPSLAALYVTHATALLQILRGQSCVKQERHWMGKQCLACFKAAAAIRVVCFGDCDPLMASTQKALRYAQQEIKSLVS
jgi:hypothetical protein